MGVIEGVDDGELAGCSYSVSDSVCPRIYFGRGAVQIPIQAQDRRGLRISVVRSGGEAIGKGGAACRGCDEDRSGRVTNAAGGSSSVEVSIRPHCEPAPGNCWIRIRTEIEEPRKAASGSEKERTTGTLASTALGSRIQVSIPALGDQSDSCRIERVIATRTQGVQNGVGLSTHQSARQEQYG